MIVSEREREKERERDRERTIMIFEASYVGRLDRLRKANLEGFLKVELN